MSFFAIALFSNNKAKTLIGLSVLFNSLLCYSFSICDNIIYLLAFRFLMGMSQALPVIFSPVWIDSMAPTEIVTTWMAMYQSAVPVGVILG